MKRKLSFIYFYHSFTYSLLLSTLLPEGKKKGIIGRNNTILSKLLPTRAWFIHTNVIIPRLATVHTSGAKQRSKTRKRNEISDPITKHLSEARLTRVFVRPHGSVSSPISRYLYFFSFTSVCSFTWSFNVFFYIYLLFLYFIFLFLFFPFFLKGDLGNQVRQ